MQRRLAVVMASGIILMLLTLSVPPIAEANPTFSRKYATSCATCHVAFPKLNAFGKAFRNNGYRFPGGDEDYIADEKVELGAEPWKRLWPKAIWPGDIPGMPPLALLIENEFEYSPDDEIQTDFATPSDVSLLTGGSLGDSMSFYGRVNLIAPGADVHVHRLFAQFDHLFGNKWLNLRVGQVETRAVPFSSNLRLAREDYLVNTATMPLATWVGYLQGLEDDHGEEEEPDHGGTSLLAAEEDDHAAETDAGHVEEDQRPGLIGIGGHQHGGGGFSMGTTQMGMEIWGATAGIRGKGGFEYAVGLVNGNGAGDFAASGKNDNNGSKDVYWRASYKVGGMSPMGEAGSAPAVTNNWQDNSIKFGAFGYHGTAPFSFSVAHEKKEEEVEHDDEMVRAFTFNALDEDPHAPAVETLHVDEKFRRIGADIDIWFNDLNLFGAYMWGQTDMAEPLLHDAEVTFNAWLAQADYMLYPWLVASLRYEGVDYDDAFGDVKRWLPHVTALLRANVKLSAEGTLYSDEHNPLFANRYRLWLNLAF